MSILILAVACGADDWTDLNMCENKRRAWLAVLLELPMEFRRKFGLLDRNRVCCLGARQEKVDPPLRGGNGSCHGVTRLLGVNQVLPLALNAGAARRRADRHRRQGSAAFSEEEAGDAVSGRNVVQQPQSGFGASRQRPEVGRDYGESRKAKRFACILGSNYRVRISPQSQIDAENQQGQRTLSPLSVKDVE